MIPFASQRASGQDLATHLLNSHDNERVEIAGVRGAIADDLHGAFAEWEAQAHALTKCKNYLYSLSINPDPGQGPLTREQYEDYIGRVEEKLGLADQPRAIVFHEKYGREHCHVVWSRIDPEREKAVQLAFDKKKLMMVTRAFARDHGLSLPDGYNREQKDQEKTAQLSLYEMEQLRATGLTKEQRIEEVTAAFRASDNARAFVQALAERGYILATGNRPYVLVDLYGEMNALPRLIADKTVRTKDIREFLGKEFPPESLPSVEEAKKLAAAHRSQIEAHLENERRAQALDTLKRSQSQRRESLEKEHGALMQRHHQERAALSSRHKTARENLRKAYLARSKWIRLQRYQQRPRGLADFLGRISGINALRKQIYRHQDKKRLDSYREALSALKDTQRDEKSALAHTQLLRAVEVQRKLRALDKVEARERRSVEQNLTREARVHARQGGIRIPSVALALKPRGRRAVPHKAMVRYAKPPRAKDADPQELEAGLERAVDGKTKPKAVDLETSFNDAAKGGDEGKASGDSKGTKPAEKTRVRRYTRKRRRDKDLDRGR